MKFTKNSYKFLHGGLADGFASEFYKEERWRWKKRKDDWFDLIAKTMIPNFELLYTDIYQPQNSASIVVYFFYNKLVKTFWEMALFITQAAAICEIFKTSMLSLS